MRVVSFYPSKKEAEDFAKDLTARGAEGVKTWPKTSAGYPVSSEVAKALALQAAEEHRKHSLLDFGTTPEGLDLDTGEKYGSPRDAERATWRLATLEMEGTKPNFTKKELLSLFKKELERIGIKGVKLSVSKYQGTTRSAPTADTTLFCSDKGRYRIALHPVMLYADRDYVREVAEHEARHILEENV